MTNYKVSVSFEAQNDINCILDYILYQLNSPFAARNLLLSFEKSILSLSNMPYRFPVFFEDGFFEHDYRILPVKSYDVFYFVDEERKTVIISRILYSGQDASLHLSEDVIPYSINKEVYYMGL